MIKRRVVQTRSIANLGFELTVLKSFFDTSIYSRIQYRQERPHSPRLKTVLLFTGVAAVQCAPCDLGRALLKLLIYTLNLLHALRLIELSEMSFLQ